MSILAAKLFILSALVAGCNRIEENELLTYCCSVSAQLFSSLREIKGSTERHGEEANENEKKKFSSKLIAESGLLKEDMQIN